MPIEVGEEVVEQVRRLFSRMRDRVKVHFFIDPESECTYCTDIREILELLSSLTDKIVVEVHTKASEEAEKLAIPMYPAIVLHGEGREYNIRFFGIPAGYEFGALVEDILDVSLGEPRSLDPELAELLRKHVKRETQIIVFVTPTCPYCPRAVRAAHRYAMVSRLIYGDMVEAIEFSELADRYSVYAVPKVIIRVDGEDKAEFVGAAPDEFFAAKILEAHGVPLPPDLELLKESIGRYTRVSELE